MPLASRLKSFIFVLLVAGLPFHLFAQNTVISGKVTASDGSPVPNVSVVIKGKSTGTSTAADGTYKITVPSGSKVTLIFSSVGFTTKKLATTAKLP